MMAVVGYYASWARFRTGAGRYTVDDIPVRKFTHLVYAFAVLDRHEYIAVKHDPHHDDDHYRRFVRLKEQKHSLKVLLGLGGWNDSNDGHKYSNLVSNSEWRSRFIRHIVSLLKGYGFDGLDVDWEYPGPGDKQGFTAWIRELGSAFNHHGLLLTISIGACPERIDGGYDIPAIAPHLHLILLMSYDFRGKWERNVNHPAPLTPQAGCHSGYNVMGAVDHLLQRGAPARKVVVGLPFYGVSWTLASRGNTRPGAPASGPGRLGRCLGEEDKLAYYEVCLAKKQGGWRDIREAGSGCYMYKDDQWVAYDDPRTMREKAEYVKNRGLGGVMIWDITTDDFEDRGGEGRNPLLTAIISGLY